ncbi:hypothetical protein [Fretibacter rubidus]|uniref:hypothetical protein n=1 Tax=Fretibacter rubidus TaxID=570162 RepID=UPI00352B1041
MIDTSSLRALIALRVTAFFAAVAADAGLAQLTSRAPMIIRLYRLLLSIERHNRDIILKAQMLSDPIWRARVYTELGGWWAAKRWRERMTTSRLLRKAKARQAKRQRPRHSDTSNPPQTGNAHRFKTDSLGQFRWAAIPRGEACESARKACRKTAEPTACAPSISCEKPVPVTPHDFTSAERTQSANLADNKSETGEPSSTPISRPPGLVRQKAQGPAPPV